MRYIDVYESKMNTLIIRTVDLQACKRGAHKKDMNELHEVAIFGNPERLPILPGVY